MKSEQLGLGMEIHVEVLAGPNKPSMSERNTITAM
jgi:hypothetical protein